MNLNKPMTIKHLLVASIAVIGISVGSTCSIVAKQGFLDDIHDLKIKNAATEQRLTKSNLIRPTFDEVDTMMDERSAFNNASERHPEIDYSEGSNEPQAPSRQVNNSSTSFNNIAKQIDPNAEFNEALANCDMEANYISFATTGKPAPGCDL